MSTDRPAPPGVAPRAAKRLFDVAASLAVLSLGAPLMAGLAVAVRLSSPGPVFFVQDRAGRGTRPFRMLKFRTMAMAPRERQALVWTPEDESRVTRVGSFMRDFGLDELPQALNILKGEMSVIGPRPPMVEQVPGYSAEQRRMFDVRPGVLSLAAVRGRRTLTPERRIADHVEYVDRWSLALDAVILWKSLLVVLGRQNARDALPSPAPGDAAAAPRRPGS